MLKQTKSLLWVMGFAAVFGEGPACAGGGGATEVTQLLNNAQLIQVQMDGAVTAAKTVSAYALQLQQYQTQLQNLQKLASLPSALGLDSLKLVNDLSSYRNALNSLQGSLTTQSNVFNTRLTEARLSGRGWSTYLAGVAEDVAMHKGRALERLRYEQGVLEQVNADYEFARELQSTIPATVGAHQSMQLMNTQMNRVVTQNAKLLEVISAQLNRSAEDDQRRALDKQQTATDLDALRQRQKAVEERQRGFGGFR